MGRIDHNQWSCKPLKVSMPKSDAASIRQSGQLRGRLLVSDSECRCYLNDPKNYVRREFGKHPLFVRAPLAGPDRAIAP
jgi:hypothetical protein